MRTGIAPLGLSLTVKIEFLKVTFGKSYCSNSLIRGIIGFGSKCGFCFKFVLITSIISIYVFTCSFGNA